MDINQTIVDYDTVIDYCKVKGDDITVMNLHRHFRINYIEACTLITQLEKDGHIVLSYGNTFKAAEVAQ
jgi:hypothetical protein